MYMEKGQAQLWHWSKNKCGSTIYLTAISSPVTVHWSLVTVHWSPFTSLQSWPGAARVLVTLSKSGNRRWLAKSPGRWFISFSLD
jgi:hypothetical protein